MSSLADDTPLHILASIASEIHLTRPPSRFDEDAQARSHQNIEPSRSTRIKSELTKIRGAIVKLRPTLDLVETCLRRVEEELQDGDLLSNTNSMPRPQVVSFINNNGNLASSRVNFRSDENERREYQCEGLGEGPENTPFIVDLVSDEEAPSSIDGGSKNIQEIPVSLSQQRETNMHSHHILHTESAAGRNIYCERRCESNVISSPGMQSIFIPSVSSGKASTATGQQELVVDPNNASKSICFRRLGPKTRRANWLMQDNLLFIKIVKENENLDDTKLRKLLAETFKNSRSYSQCASHLRVLRSHGLVPKKDDETGSFEGI